MRKKLFGKLLSVALSATMAVTSAVPAYAAVDTDLAEETPAEQPDDVTEGSDTENEVEEKEESLTEGDVTEEKTGDAQKGAPKKGARMLGNTSENSEKEEGIELTDAGTYAFVYSVGDGAVDHTVDGKTVVVKTTAENKIDNERTQLASAPEPNERYHKRGTGTNWFLKDGNVYYEIDNNTTIISGGTFYALYDKDTYNVSWNAKFYNGSELVDPQPSGNIFENTGIYPTTTCYDEDWNINPAPDIDGYDFDAWYFNENCTRAENTTEKQEIQSVMDGETNGVTINVYAKYIKDTSEGGDLKIAGDENVEFDYGVETGNKVVFTANEYDSTWKKYTEATWSLYKIKDSAPGIDGGGVDDPRYSSENLEEITSLSDYGITFSQSVTDKSQFVFGTTGPKKALDGNFLIKITNNSGTKAAVLEVKIIVNGAKVTVTDTDESSGGNINDKIINFGSVKMGYDVTEFGKTKETPYVAKQKVTISDSAISSSYKLDDLTYEWDGKDTKAFDYVTDHNGVYIGENETLTISPVEDLDNYYDSDHDGIYEATLYAKSKGFIEKVKIVEVKLTVTTNVEFESATAHGGKAATKEVNRTKVTVATDNPDAIYYYSGTSGETTLSKQSADRTGYVDVYDLGKVKVGTYFSDVLITAAGGVDKLEMVEINEESAFNETGVTGLPNSDTGKATYRVSGTPTKQGVIKFYLRAKDAHNNSTMVQGYKLTVEGPDVTYSIDGESITVGTATKDGNIFNWYGAKDYTPAGAAKSLIISNNSEESITIKAELKASGSNNAENYMNQEDASGTFVLSGLNTNGELVISSGGSGTINITPKAGLTSENSTILKLSGESGVISDTSINLTFTVNSDELEITNPARDSTQKGVYIGIPFTYELGVTKSSLVKDIKWSVSNVKIGDTDYNSVGAIRTQLTKYGISINENTGIVVGMPKDDIASLQITFKATAELTNGNKATKKRIIDFVIKGSPDEFELTSDGNVIDDDENILDLGTISIDKIDTISRIFSVKNASSLDISKTKAVIPSNGVKKGETLNSAVASTDTFFKLVFDSENSNLDSELSKGFELTKGASREITLEVNEGSAAGQLQKVTGNAGTYWIEVNVTDESDAANGIAKFVAKLKVTDAPIIDASLITGLTVGSEIKENESTKKYEVSMGGVTKTSDYTFAWTGGSVPGLSLTTDGRIYGKATKAGEFEVTVEATNKNDGSVKGVLTHIITVAGDAVLNVASTTAVGDPAGKYVLLPGIVVGDSVNKTAETFNIKSESDTAKNVKITVEDAPDDRKDASEIAADPSNPYSGSTNYIGVNMTGFSEITTTGTENFSIVTKSSVAPGVYKVKITITADNANEIVFYAIMAVVEKFAITQPGNITTKIGKAYTVRETNSASYVTDGDLEISATGGAGAQTIVWSETGTKEASGTTETTRYYVTSNGTANGTSSVTGFKLVGSRGRIDGKATTSTANAEVTPAALTGSKAYLTATAVGASGNYSVTLKAKIEATDVNTTVADKMSKAISLSNTIVKAANTKAFPAQEAAPVTFVITSGKSDDVKITGVTGATNSGTIEGFKNGTVYVTRTGFTYNPVTASYTNTSKEISLTVSNEMAGVSAKVKAAFGENSNFEVVGSSEATIAASGTGAFTIRPKAKLAKGTYTDTLTLSGNEFESVTFDVSFTVEDSTYLADVIGTVDEEDVKFVENSVKVSGKTVILNNYIVDGTKSNTSLTVKNVGNTAISNVSVYEVKEDGTKYATGSSETMLSVGVIATSIEAGATKAFSVTAKKNVAGVYTSYVNLHYTEGTSGTATEKDVWFPITYTVYTKDMDTITVSPETKTTITVAENYNRKNASAEFVIKNTATGAENTLTGFVVDSTNLNFEVTPSTVADLAAGQSATYKIIPKAGKMLSAGEYTTKLSVSGGNIKTAIERDITLVVTEAEEYTIKATTTGVIVDDAAIAEKLWNTFAYGKAISLEDSKKSETTKTVKVDVDDDGSEDVSLVFTFSENVTNLDSTKNKNIDSVKAKIISGTNVSTASKSITLKTTEQTKAVSGHGDTYVSGTDAHDAKFFTTVSFNFYGTVTFGTGATSANKLDAGTQYAENYDDLVNEYVTPQFKSTITNSKDKAIGTITALVPYGEKLGSVFTSGDLPTAIAAGQVMVAWYSGNSIITANRVIIGDLNVNATTTNNGMHEHEYAAANDKDEAHVKWVWSEDEKGNLSAVLHLYCVNDNCPDVAGCYKTSWI